MLRRTNTCPPGVRRSTPATMSPPAWRVGRSEANFGSPHRATARPAPLAATRLRVEPDALFVTVTNFGALGHVRFNTPTVSSRRRETYFDIGSTPTVPPVGLSPDRNPGVRSKGRTIRARKGWFPALSSAIHSCRGACWEFIVMEPANHRYTCPKGRLSATHPRQFASSRGA